MAAREACTNDLDWDNLPPSTIPAGLPLVVKGFEDVGAARMLGQAVLEVTDTIGSFIDLASLDGVTIAVDYDTALDELDQGMEGMRPLRRSDSEVMQGVAMSPAVLRGGAVKTHLVFRADMLVPLILEESSVDEKAVSIGIIAHECAHVQITALNEASIPEARLGARIKGFERAIMFQIAEICWDEYAACRLSAFFARRQNEHHAQTVIACAQAAREEASAAIRSYRLHGDEERLVGEAGEPLFKPIKAVAYLLGGMDGADAGWESFAEVRSALDRADLWGFVPRLHLILRQLWETQASWEPSKYVFAPLLALLKEIFHDAGLIFRPMSDGTCFISVPFTLETIP